MRELRGPRRRAWHRPLAAAAALFAIVLTLYSPVRRFDFVQLDDNEYVTENAFVRTGLSPTNVEWALTAFHSGHWHPLTWLSLMFDCHWSGADPGALHVVNALLHASAAALLMLWLRMATGSLWLSAFIAALFALHPLRVESVAWIAARKDVLSGLFVMLTLAAYVRYTRRESPGRHAVVMIAFALALLAKPTVVILPCCLLLLDHWPLGRTPRRWRPGFEPSTAVAERSPAWLLAEKLPLVALALLTLTLTWSAQHAAGAVVQSLPLAQRVANAAWNYALYAGRTVWPFDLAVFYPLHPVPVVQAAGAALALALLTWAAWGMRSRAPYLLVGWLWFLGTLLPVSGIIQFGGQAMADRYSYLPHIGLFLALGCAAADVAARWKVPRVLVAFVAVVLLAGLAARSGDQLRYWSDSVTLLERAIATTSGNYLAHNNLGVAFEKLGRKDEAARHYAEAVRLNPTWPEARNNYGIACAWRGDLAEARTHFAEALRIRPDFAMAHNNLGTTLLRQGDTDGAISHYSRAVELSPAYVDARLGLADAFERRGRLRAAEEQYVRVLELQPLSPEAANRLARVRAAIAEWMRVHEPR